MNLQSVLASALAGVCLCLAGVFFMHHPDPHVGRPNTVLAPNSYLEWMPESSDEFSRFHILEHGVETQILIKYKDDSRGRLVLGPHGQTVIQERFFKDGSPKLKAQFDAAGNLIGGFENRLDGTKVWKASLQPDQNTVELNSFWPNGQLFLHKETALDSKISRTTFYRSNGVRWQDLQYKGDVLWYLHAYDEGAHLRLSLELVMKTSEDSAFAPLFGLLPPQPAYHAVYLNADGTVDFGQWWTYKAKTQWDPDSGIANPTPLVITGVDIFEEGKLKTEYTLSFERKPKTIDRHQDNGITIRQFVQYNGDITRQDYVSDTGVSTFFDYSGQFGVAEPVPKRFLLPLPAADVPYKSFNGQAVRAN